MYLPKHLGKPVVGIDIDGTLGDYHEHFLAFAEKWYGREFPPPDKINPGLPLYKFMGTSKEQYRKCKLAFRQGGMKRSMPVYPNARLLTVEARKAGAQVFICTSRPYNQLGNIEPDTAHWLRRNKIQYDGFVWGENKYRDLTRAVGKEQVVVVLDDLPEMCEQALELGLHTLIRDQPYNQHYSFAHRVYDLFEAMESICRNVERYVRNVKGKR